MVIEFKQYFDSGKHENIGIVTSSPIVYFRSTVDAQNIPSAYG